jgi:outer membrane protein assembly factor BamB
LWCIDITKKGDISREIDAGKGEQAPAGGELLRPGGAARKGKPNPNSGVVWDFEKHDVNNDGKIRGSERMNRTISTVAVYNGLVFAPDFSGFLHCLDAKTGQHQWTYDMEAAMWGSPLAVDGKVYLADEDGDIAIFNATKDGKEPIAEHNVGNATYGSPVFANDTLYIMAKDRLIAIANGAKSAPAKGE